jgi:hypothetical protein
VIRAKTLVSGLASELRPIYAHNGMVGLTTFTLVLIAATQASLR